jgi:hypothetical protein
VKVKNFHRKMDMRKCEITTLNLCKIALLFFILINFVQSLSASPKHDFEKFNNYTVNTSIILTKSERPAKALSNPIKGNNKKLVNFVFTICYLSIVFNHLYALPFSTLLMKVSFMNLHCAIKSFDTLNF